MVRPTWKASEEQRKLIAAANKAIKRAEAVAQRAEDKAWEAVKLARDSGVPDTQLCTLTGIPRSTLIRRLGPREDDLQKADPAGS